MRQSRHVFVAPTTTQPSVAALSSPSLSLSLSLSLSSLALSLSASLSVSELGAAEELRQALPLHRLRELAHALLAALLPQAVERAGGFNHGGEAVARDEEGREALIIDNLFRPGVVACRQWERR